MSNDTFGASSEAKTSPKNGSHADSGAPAKSSRVVAPMSLKKPQTLMTEISYPVDVSIKNMLEAGAHFGHQTQRWNPKMLPSIYCAKNGIHIMNLDVTLARWTRARKFIVDTVGRGGTVLFVGTKLQAREIVQHEASRAGAFYVTTRWLGGTLSNFQTIKNSIDRMRKLEELLAQAEVEGSKVKITKKEKLEITREVGKLEQSLGGIRQMKRTPDVIFVIDVIKEAIAVEEARRLRIPVVAMVDTNVNPDKIEYPIPSNDDAARAIRLFTAAVADAVIEGKAVFGARPARERQELSTQLEGRAAAQQSNSAENRERDNQGGRGGGRGGRGRGRGGDNRGGDHRGGGDRGAAAAAPEAAASNAAPQAGTTESTDASAAATPVVEGGAA
jgi:small subunit ribosomal protein S2